MLTKHGRRKLPGSHYSEGAKIRPVPRCLILRVRSYLEQELRTVHRINLKKIVDRTASATGVPTSIVCKIKTEEDVENWRFKAGENLQVALKCVVPNNFSIIVRQVIRDIFLANKKLPTIDQIYEKICALKVEDVFHLKLFGGDEIPDSERNIWVWLTFTLFRVHHSDATIFIRPHLLTVGLNQMNFEIGFSIDGLHRVQK